VVVAGEDRNDRQSLRVLLEKLCPQMRGRIVEINDTVRLRGASKETVAGRVATLARKVRARGALEQADVACVFIHEDLDGTDGDEYAETRMRVQEALTAEFGTAQYVLAVWEIEAWLLLFPDALRTLVRAWSVPSKYRNADTGGLTDPKRILMTELGKAGRRYRESDAPDVFAAATALDCLDRPAGTNRSWDQFRSDARSCCRSHLPAQRTPR
jgi:hypothetical protein